LAAAAWGVGSLAGAPPSRIALSESAVAHNAVVRLSDLLPAGSPAELRESANRIVLGAAPLPGAHRAFSRSSLEAALASFPEVRDSLEIPTSVDVTRWARSLTQKEVLSAIQKSFQANHSVVADDVSPAEISFGTSVLVGDPPVSPEVTGVDMDRARKIVRVRLWIPSEPHIEPFWVSFPTDKAEGFRGWREAESGWAPMSDGVSSDRAIVSSRLSNPEQRSNLNRAASATASDVVVRSGSTVELTLRSSGMQIATTATALQSGRAGEPIRVRIAPSGRVMVAVIAGPREVNVNF
jgi:flagella basal body P-ring formation protein FlgA